MAFSDDAAGDAFADTELPVFACDGMFDAAFAECEEADDCDINQFRRYGSRLVVVPMPKIDWLFDALLPVLVRLSSGDAVGAYSNWTFVRWIEPMPLPADATEFVDAPTIECDPLGWVAFKLVLLGDQCVKSSSTISVLFFVSSAARYLQCNVCVFVLFG